MREVPSWPEYFMIQAITTSLRSKDPSTQVGSVIVDENKRIVSQGYNGMPPGYPEDDKCWERPTKYGLVLHSERNAIDYAKESLKGCTIYTTLFPCIECAKSIVSKGISSVVYLDYRADVNTESYAFLLKCGIEMQRMSKARIEGLCVELKRRIGEISL